VLPSHQGSLRETFLLRNFELVTRSGPTTPSLPLMQLQDHWLRRFRLEARQGSFVPVQSLSRSSYARVLMISAHLARFLPFLPLNSVACSRKWIGSQPQDPRRAKYCMRWIAGDVCPGLTLSRVVWSSL